MKIMEAEEKSTDSTNILPTVTTEARTGLNAGNAFGGREQFQEIYDIGKMLAASALVPQSYQGKPIDCAIAVDMANRMNLPPMMVMQNLYVVKGKPSWSGQACMAMVRANGEFRDVKHVYVGAPGSDDRGCYLTAVRASTGEQVDGPLVDMKMVKAEGWDVNKKWKTMPDLMLAYRCAAFFARIHIPNALMGCHVEGEVEDVQPAKVEVVDPFAGEGGKG